MATITSTGAFSGLDVDSIVKQLMQIERQPLARSQSQEASYTAKVTAYGTLKSGLSTFQTAVKGLADVAKFTATSATIADTNVAGATAGNGAAVGNYTLEVSKLAQNQKLATAGQASVNTAIGSGTLTFDFGTIGGGAFDAAAGAYSGAAFVSNGGGTKSITIDNTNNTLAGIRDAINGAKMGVTATIVNDGGASPYRLALTSANTGEAYSMKISASGDAALSDLMSHDPAGVQKLSQKQAAQNAQFKLDGIAISKPTNTISDAIAGVTLTLKKETEAGKPTSVNVGLDSTGVTTAVKSFVDGYNALQKSLSSLTNYDAENKKASVLTGDATTRGIQSALRGVLSSAVGGGTASFASLSEIGVSLQKDGTLGIDNTKLQKAITENYGKIAGLFATVGNATDTQVAYSASSSKTKPGTYAVSVTRLATQSAAAGSSAAQTTITAGVNDELSVKLDGLTKTIKLAAGNYASVDALAAEIQTKVNGDADFSKQGSAVTVSQNGGVLTLTSKAYGSGSNVTVGGGSALASLFGGATANTLGLDAAGTINGVAASGSGQFLVGVGGNDAEGLKVKIDGGPLGARGSVTFSQGYATRFDKVIAGQLASDGAIASRTDGLNLTLKTLDKNQEAMTKRLDVTEKRLRAQYAALDSIMSKLTSTGSALASQLSGLRLF